MDTELDTQINYAARDYLRANMELRAARDKCRAVAHAAVAAGYTEMDIAARLGVHLTTVRKWLSKGNR